MPTTTINWNDLEYLLDDAFPGLIFSPPNNAENLDILNYVEPAAGGKYRLDMDRMSRSENFAHLFHEDFTALWNDPSARKKYGGAGVIMFSINLENEKFLNEFYKIKNANMVKIGDDAVPNMFLGKLGFNNINKKKPVWEGWDLSKIVKHKSPTIYKAFERYAHKIYTLSGFGLWKLYKENRNALEKCGADALLLAGNKLVNDIEMEEVPDLDSLSVERRIAIFELEQEILESFQQVGAKYVPYLLTDIETFRRQLGSGLSRLLKTKYIDDPDQVNHVETFNSGERKNINRYFIQLGQYIENAEDFNEYNETQINGTYREKVMFLYQQGKIVRAYFSKTEQEIIWGIIGKLSLPVSFDEPLKNNDDGETFILYDITVDRKNVSADEHLSWTALFTDIFKNQFDETQMKKFLECIPQHFSEYPPGYDKAGNFIMTYYSKKQLFKTFCITAGMEEEQEIWEMFLVKMQKLINNINTIRSELRRKA